MQIENVAMVAMGGFVAWNLFRMIAGKVPPARARELVQGGALLLDVRTPGEFGGGHLPGAKNVPLQELATRMRELGEKDKPIVLYCASGMRSASARSMLKRAGFANVHDLGSMGRWQG